MPDEPTDDLVPVKTPGLTRTIEAGKDGFVLKTIEDAVNFARWNFESGLLPEHIRDTKQAFAIMARGAEIGLKPHASWRWLYMTKAGKIAMETKGKLAVCQASSHFAGYKEFIQNEAGPPEGWVAVAVARRKGREDQVKEFSYTDAQRAGLLQKKRSRKTGDMIDGPYQLYLKDMLLARARDRVLDLQFGDILGGMQSKEIAEEVEDREAEDGTARRRVDPPKVKVVDPLMAAATVKVAPAPAPEPAVEAEVVDDDGDDVPEYEGEVGLEEELEDEDDLPLPDEAEADEAEAQHRRGKMAAVKPWECPGCGTLQAKPPCDNCGMKEGDLLPPPARAKAKTYMPGDRLPDGRIVEEVDDQGRPTVVKTPLKTDENPFEKGRQKAIAMRERARKEAEQQSLPKE